MMVPEPWELLALPRLTLAEHALYEGLLFKHRCLSPTEFALRSRHLLDLPKYPAAFSQDRGVCSVFICIYIYLYIHTCICIWMYIEAQIHAYIYIYIYTHLY